MSVCGTCAWAIMEHRETDWYTWNNWKKKDNTREGLEDPGQRTTKGSDGALRGRKYTRRARQPPQRAYCLGRLHRPQHRGCRSSRSSRGGDGPGSLGRPSSQGRALGKREPHRRRTPQTCRAPPLISTSLWGTYTRLRKEPPKSIRGNDTQAHTTTPQEWKTPQLMGNSGKHAEGSGLTYRSWKKRPEKDQTISEELNQRTELKNIYKIQKQPAPNAWHAI